MKVSRDVGHAAPGLGAGRFEVRGTLGAGGAGVAFKLAWQICKSFGDSLVIRCH